MKNKSSILVLVISLPLIFFAIVLSNMSGQSEAGFWSDLLNLLVTSILLAVCIVNNFKMGVFGKQGKAWMFFTVAITMWYVAERIWTFNELTNTNTAPSYADIFWFGGYVFYFMFGAMYLKPFAKQISRKNIVIASIAALTTLILMAYTVELEQNTFENILYASYPVADSIMLIPSILGMILFFKGHVRFSWSLLFFGMIIFVISDYIFMYVSSIGEYYTGHFADIPYIWAYVIFIAGLMSNMDLFSRIDKSKPFNDQDALR